MSDPEVIYESYGNKLIGAGATGGGSSEQVQADWEQSDTTAPDYIKSKPSLSTVATSGDYEDLSNKPSLSTVATSGDYGDLSNKPSTTSSVTSGSSALVTSGGVYSAIHDDIVVITTSIELGAITQVPYGGWVRRSINSIIPSGYTPIIATAYPSSAPGGELMANGFYYYDSGTSNHWIYAIYHSTSAITEANAKIFFQIMCKKN